MNIAVWIAELYVNPAVYFAVTDVYIWMFQKYQKMERTIVTPQSTDLHISIPEKYIGKRVEVIFFDVDEANRTKYPESTNSVGFILDARKKAILDAAAKTPDHLCISEEESFRRLNELL